MIDFAPAIAIDNEQAALLDELTREQLEDAIFELRELWFTCCGIEVPSPTEFDLVIMDD